MQKCKLVSFRVLSPNARRLAPNSKPAWGSVYVRKCLKCKQIISDLLFLCHFQNLAEFDSAQILMTQISYGIPILTHSGEYYFLVISHGRRCIFQRHTIIHYCNRNYLLFSSERSWYELQCLAILSDSYQGNGCGVAKIVWCELQCQSVLEYRRHNHFHIILQFSTCMLNC